MPPKKCKMPRQRPAGDPFLRSINIRYDARDANRIAHFRPTTKCIALLRALLAEEQDRSFLIVAPYGTGKSLTATYLLQLVENRTDSAAVLLDIGEKLSAVSPELGRFATDRRKNFNSRGIVIALHGPCESLARSVKEALLESMSRLKLGRSTRTIRSMPAETVEDAIAILECLKKQCHSSGCDRVAIVWDEFGRHLDSLVSEGRGDALGEIQSLAEFVARSRTIPMTLGLLLHQGLLHYAGNLPQTVRTDWKKIEGRFHTIQYIDDSKEIYRLVAEVTGERATAPSVSRRKAAIAAKKCKDLGIFADFTQSELADLLHVAQPLDPVALYLLPRVSARVAQNERTLFNFLNSADVSTRVDVACLFDYFSAAMRSDTAVGGTHRQWLETESALTKVPDDEDAGKVLKTACLLGLGTSGQRSRTGRELLLLALEGFDAKTDWKRTVGKLIDRKLLLHRQHNDEVSVWHGTDLDLRGRLEEERRQIGDNFNLVKFLTKEAKPPSWKPLEYNDDYGVRRYLMGEYQTVGELNALLKWEVILAGIANDCDGKVVYLVAENADDFNAAEGVAREKLSHDRLIVAIPREPLPLREAALEVACLTRMQHDKELVDSDPLALSEIQQMTDDAREHLQKLIDKLTKPAPLGPRWLYRGSEVVAESPRNLRRQLSEVMRQVYPYTPRIHNEMIVRKKPSPVVINARKKLLLGILERHGQEDLGIQGNFPDKSMLRTVLLLTGLYMKDRHGRWGYVAPRALRDPGLQAVWRKIQEFLTVPSDTPKKVAAFLDELSAPPFGLRAGLLPILFAAGLKAFPSAVSLTRNGKYVDDILPSEIEQLCRTPEQYRLSVLDFDDARTRYLRNLHKRFTPVKGYEAAENDLIRLCFDAIESWKAQLPPAAMSTRRLSRRTTKFREALARTADPVYLMFDAIPEACEAPVDKPRTLFSRLDQCIAELAGVASIYAGHAATSLRHNVALGGDSHNDNVRSAAKRWAGCFCDGFVESLSDGVAKGLLARMQMAYDSDELLLNSLSSLLVGKPLSRWDDSTVAVFDREFQSIVRRIEDIALSSDGILSSENGDKSGIRELVRGRMSELFERLAKLIGVDEATSVLQSISRQPEGT
jgi:hypothetical protein